MHFGPYVCVAGPYEGGFGRVFKATRHDMPGVYFAVKTVKDAMNQDQRRALAREVKVLSKVNHPQVIKLLEHRLEDAVPFVVLEYLPGGSLRPHVGKFTVEGTFALLHHMAGAVGAFHGAGGFHRDIKPDNMLVAPDGSAVLVDAGLANVPAPGSGLTRHIAGTPGYVDPWVVNREYDAAADVFSLAVTVVELLTGHPPASLCSAQGFALSPAQLPIPSAEHRAAFHALIAAMMRSDRALRPSAGVIQQYAYVLLTGGQLPSLPQPPKPVRVPPAQGDVAGAIAATALVALLAVGVVALLSGAAGGTGGGGGGGGGGG